MRKNNIIKINLPGGVVAAGDLNNIISAAENAGAGDMQFGTRQQLYIKVRTERAKLFTDMLSNAGIIYEVDKDENPSIVSSYVAEDVFQSANWMREGVYKDLLDTFTYAPSLKINIVDNNQSFVPFFTGNLNFIAAPISNYWFLYIRFPKTTIIYRWPVLIYSFDMSRISKLIEEIIFNHKNLYYDQDAINGESLYRAVTEKEPFITQNITEDLRLPDFKLHYYEGFNSYENKTWLGIYRRNELFPLAFLKDVCSICLQTKIGQVYITPWKSIIIKDIENKDRKLWDFVLGKYRINVRHASNELNWQIEDLSEEGLNLKRYLVSQFDRDDVRTYGLCFAIKTKPKSGLFGSVIIRKQKNLSSNQRASLDRYDILYTKDFNPNTKELVLFRSNVEKENLFTYLVSLCKYYYELQSATKMLLHSVYKEQVAEEPQKKIFVRQVHECKDCFTIYDDAYGDLVNNVPPGIAFSELPIDYCCPTCGSPKDQFMAVEKTWETRYRKECSM